MTIVVGMRMNADTKKFAAIAAPSSNLENHLYTSVPLSAKNTGMGIA